MVPSFFPCIGSSVLSTFNRSCLSYLYCAITRKRRKRRAYVWAASRYCMRLLARFLESWHPLNTSIRISAARLDIVYHIFSHFYLGCDLKNAMLSGQIKRVICGQTNPQLKRDTPAAKLRASSASQMGARLVKLLDRCY